MAKKGAERGRPGGRGPDRQEILPGIERCRVRGRRGEDLALDWLTTHGYEVLEQNLRRRQAGEVDLVARRGDTLHVVEVKCGRGPLDLLLERVDERKIRLLLKTLVKAGWLDEAQRYRAVQVDLLLVELREPAPRLTLVADVCPPELQWAGGADG
ncbi:MAG: YraN family protein [bacterium]|jgi:Holliday junction resolvase-like predicted endonuclease|nr:YraN family protein [bacterium]